MVVLKTSKEYNMCLRPDEQTPAEPVQGMVEQQPPSERVQFDWKNILEVEANVPGC